MHWINERLPPNELSSFHKSFFLVLSSASTQVGWKRSLMREKVKWGQSSIYYVNIHPFTSCSRSFQEEQPSLSFSLILNRKHNGDKIIYELIFDCQKFMYSQKYYESPNLYLTLLINFKKRIRRFRQFLVAFSEYMNVHSQ